MVCALASLTCLGGCGLAIPSQTEIWDAKDFLATEHMVKQIKLAIYCDLRDAVIAARNSSSDISFRGRPVTTTEDVQIPDTWGAQVTLTLTTDETSKLTPGVSLTNLAKTFTFGLGGTLSSQATRVDKYDTFYSIADITGVYSQQQICEPAERAKQSQPRSSSSPFLVNSDLGIKTWLPQAAAASRFLRSSRTSETGVGPPLSSGGFSSDSISYDIKFNIESGLTATPTLTLKRVGSEDALALTRARTHQLLITIGPADTEAVKGKKGVTLRVLGPSQSATNSHLAQQIGDAVAQSIRSDRGF